MSPIAMVSIVQSTWEGRWWWWWWMRRCTWSRRWRTFGGDEIWRVAVQWGFRGVLSLKRLGCLQSKCLVWQGGATDSSYGHHVWVGMIVPFPIKACVGCLRGLVDLVIIPARESSLIALNLLLKVSISEQNKITRRFCTSLQWLVIGGRSREIFHHNG
jgi:hypothetical protein